MFRQRQQRQQQLGMQKEAAVKAEQRRAQAAAAAQLNRGQALQAARIHVVGAGLLAPQSEAQPQGSHTSVAAPIASSSSSSHGFADSSISATASASASASSALARYTQHPSPVVIPPNCIGLTYLHSFLSADECATLIELGAGNFSRSWTTLGISPIRTSDSAVLTNSQPVVLAVRQRVAQITGARDEWIESLVLVRYQPGQQFLPHHDSQSSAGIPPRSHTIFAYLNDLPDGAGGETEFTKIGVKFKPKCGDALFWENQADRHSHHLDGEHAGRPPLSGVKFGE